MQVVSQCPNCERIIRSDVTPSSESINCSICEWSVNVEHDDIVEGAPNRCLLCGCDDLWRQKDFPPRLGLTIAAIGASLCTIAYYMYYPKTTFGILMVFLLVDAALYACMKDVLVCYSCGARHRRAALDKNHPAFNLELAERYRQEAKRLDDTRNS